jgi:dihydroorotate dehydrogenase (NAD+) catalytic subunit
MTTTEIASEALVPPQAISGLIRDLSDRISAGELAREVGTDELLRLKGSEAPGTREDAWKLLRVAYKYGFFDIFPRHGVPPVTFNINSPFDLLGEPIGFEQELPAVALKKRPTDIAGFNVDFPLGLPASVLASNAKWIEFYAKRGFDILTYKTVRSTYRAVHRWPNWVFLKDPHELVFPFNQPVVGEQGWFPAELSQVSMANSFGIPSLDPAWWMDDIRRAKASIHGGHQVLIVSVVASRNENREALAEDFVITARAAKEAGADIVEANYSCPNILNDPAGELFQNPTMSAFVSEALHAELGATPLFVKVGYLAEPDLRAFVLNNSKFVDGIVGINAISSPVLAPDGSPVFPERKSAGISGWSISRRAHEIAQVLVSLRKEVFAMHGKRLTMLSVGGVVSRQDFLDRLDTGVDAVESCTGAFLNPYLGLEVRDAEPVKTALQEFLSTSLRSDHFLNLVKHAR